MHSSCDTHDKGCKQCVESKLDIGQDQKGSAYLEEKQVYDGQEINGCENGKMD